ncbi:MAG: hypothetical protein ACKKL5_01460 [Candidatus Komeilibacteria bacterium]
MIRKIIVKIGSNWIFLILILILYLFTLFINNNLFIKSILYAKDVMIEVIPVLIIVFVLTFLANIWLTTKKANKLLVQRTGPWQYMVAIFLGILSSGPIYMWYPLLSELKAQGLKNSLIAIFLYNRAVKIPLIPMIIFYFGLPFLLITSCFMIIFSLINGYLVAKFTNN